MVRVMISGYEIASNICWCRQGELRSSARPVCPECGGRLPLRILLPDIALYGRADEIIGGLSGSGRSVNTLWGVRESDKGPGLQPVLALGFPRRSGDLYEKARFILHKIDNPLILKWDRLIENTTGSYTIWPMPFVPLTIYSQDAGAGLLTWKQSFMFGYRGLEMLRDFGAVFSDSWGNASPTPALQCFWPQNMVFDPNSRTRIDTLSVVDISLWSSAVTIKNPSAFPFLAPEARDGRVQIGPKSDIYSIAAMTYYLAQGLAIGPNPSERSLKPVPGHGRRELLRSMLDPVPALRPSAEEALIAMKELM